MKYKPMGRRKRAAFDRWGKETAALLDVEYEERAAISASLRIKFAEEETWAHQKINAKFRPQFVAIDAKWKKKIASIPYSDKKRKA